MFELRNVHLRTRDGSNMADNKVGAMERYLARNEAAYAAECFALGEMFQDVAGFQDSRRAFHRHNASKAWRRAFAFLRGDWQAVKDAF